MTHSIHLGFSCSHPSAVTRFESSPEATPPPVMASNSEQSSPSPLSQNEEIRSEETIIAQTIIDNDRQFGRRDLARELDPSCSDDDLSTSDSVSAQATRKITKAEAEALLTDYPALMKHRFIAEADTENPDRWNVSSVMLPRDMHAQYSIGLEGCGPDIFQMDSSELLTRLMESQFDEA